MIAIILYYYIYLIIYRGKTKASRSKGRGRTKAKDVSDLFARSSPLFCSVCCPRRPHHRQPLIGSHHQQRRGKSGHPARLWVDAIATTSPPIDQQPEWQPLVLSVILPASSSLLFRLLSSPSAPSPAAHRVEPSTKERDGRPPRPVLGDAIATTSPHLAADRPAEGQRLVLSVILPASSSSPSSSPPSGGEGREESHPGRAIPSRSSCRPSPPCRGVRENIS